MQVRRNSSTTYDIEVSNGTEWDADMFNSANYTCPSTIDAMDKLWFGCENAGSGSAGMVSKTSHVQFADGVTVAPT